MGKLDDNGIITGKDFRFFTKPVFPGRFQGNGIGTVHPAAEKGVNHQHGAGAAVGP